MKKMKFQLFSALAVLVLGGAAKADIVVPGSGSAPADGTGSLAGLTFVTSTTNTLTSPDVSASVTESVYLDVGGAFGPADSYDFVYQMTNTGTSGAGDDLLSRLIGTNYSGFSTDLRYIVGTGVAPDSRDRIDASGDNPGFDFTTGTPAGLGYGATSAKMVIYTNAFAYKAGSVGVSDGLPTFSTAFYAPAAVPEPSFYGFLAIGLVGIVVAGKSRKKDSVV